MAIVGQQNGHYRLRWSTERAQHGCETRAPEVSGLAGDGAQGIRDRGLVSAVYDSISPQSGL